MKSELTFDPHESCCTEPSIYSHRVQDDEGLWLVVECESCGHIHSVDPLDPTVGSDSKNPTQTA